MDGDYQYDYQTNSGISGTALAIILIIYLAIVIFEIAATWKVFTKAGRPGWAAIIPIYNTYVLLKISGKPGWWLILFFIPIVNIVFTVLALNALSRSFGRGAGFTVGLFFLGFIFMPILGFGSSRYIGPDGVPTGGYGGYPQGGGGYGQGGYPPPGDYGQGGYPPPGNYGQGGYPPPGGYGPPQ